MTAGYSRVHPSTASDGSQSDSAVSTNVEALAHRGRGTRSRLDRREDHVAGPVPPKTTPLSRPAGRAMIEPPAIHPHTSESSARRGTSLSSTRPSSSHSSMSSSEGEPVRTFARHHRFPPPDPRPWIQEDLPDIPSAKSKPRLPLRNIYFRFPNLFNHDGLPHYPSNRYLPVRADSDTEGVRLEAAQEHDLAVVRVMEGRAREEAIDASANDNVCLPVFLSISLVLFPMILTCFVLACIFMLTGTSGGF